MRRGWAAGADAQGSAAALRVELVFALCEAYNVEVVIINLSEQPLSDEEELAQDVLEIITVFSARLYGSRSHKNRQLLETLPRQPRSYEDAARLSPNWP